MRAAVYHGPGDVRVCGMPEPGPPEGGELLIDVVAASICGTDASEWSDGPHLIPLHRPHPATGRSGPVVLGHEFVGRVATVGGDATPGLAPGDLVVCGAGISCGTCAWCLTGRTNLCRRYYTLGLHADGGLADQVLAPARICRLVPKGLDAHSAALAQPLAVAVHAVRRSAVAPEDVLVVIGVGGIGAFVVAAAAARGVTTLVAVDIDDARLETARRLGATVLVHARQGDPAAALMAATGGEGAHVVIEASGARDAPALALAATRRGGRTVIVGLQSHPSAIDLFDAAVREVDIVTTLAHVCDIDLPEALDVLSRRDLASIAIDRVIPLEQVVDDGLRALAEGTATGKIVVDIAAGRT